MRKFHLDDRFSAAFARTPSGELITCTAPPHDLIREHWSEFAVAITLSPPQPFQTWATENQPPQPLFLSQTVKLAIKISLGRFVVYESREGRENGVVLGLIFGPPHELRLQVESDDVLAPLFLSQISLFTSAPSQNNSEDLTNAIVNLFDTRLRYITKDDKWQSHGGRELFFKQVRDFVQRRGKLEFCLPAFPCKSSNPEKVSGVMPDRGEQLALEYLDSFLESLENIYEPGAKLYVLSDGHVFSDCIGVDDETVDNYNAQLISMYKRISQRQEGRDRIEFKSLIDLFDLKHSMAAVQNILRIPRSTIPIATVRTEEADVSRQILEQGFEIDDVGLDCRLESRRVSALKLYRGLSRFMQEDLRINPYTNGLSRTQLKSLSCRVALEMMRRNETYSKFIKLLFPHQIRLSIHAHDNAGPKFGIRLFGPEVRPLESLSFDAVEIRSDDSLHVPTPWHNCLVEVSGQSTLIMAKRNTVKKALSSGKFGGGWVPGVHGGTAGYFRLVPIEPMECKTAGPPQEHVESPKEASDEESKPRVDNTNHALMTTTTDADLVKYT